jgi:poly-gamma-glutamate synthesis protein (capsule biosynthesis protein)
MSLVVWVGADQLSNEPDATASMSTTTAGVLEATTTTGVASPVTTLPPITTTSVARSRLIIHAVGDVNLDADVLGVFQSEGFGHAWSGLGGLFVSDDLTIVNLECSPSPDGPAETKEFVFGCWTEGYPDAVAAGVDVVNLGNNHSQDHGKAAMLEGRDLLAEAGLHPVGAGSNDLEAGAPAIFEIGGWKVAVLGFGGVIPWEGWLATADRAGMRDGDTIETMVEAVRAADAVADIVLVTIHWGVELDLAPRPEDRERARAMIEAGADAIFGHHPHRLQPMRMIKGRPVAWSLGNFVWPRLSTAGSTTAVARVVFEPDGTVDGCLIPVEIVSDGHPVLVGEAPCGPPIGS